MTRRRQPVALARFTLGGAARLAVAGVGDPGPDPCHDLVRLVLGDLDELVEQIAALGRDQGRTARPDEICGKCLIALAASLEVGTSEYSRRHLPAAQVVHDGVVRDLVWHLCLSTGSRECWWRRSERVHQR